MFRKFPFVYIIFLFRYFNWKIFWFFFFLYCSIYFPLRITFFNSFTWFFLNSSLWRLSLLSLIVLISHFWFHGIDWSILNFYSTIFLNFFLFLNFWSILNSLSFPLTHPIPPLPQHFSLFRKIILFNLRSLNLLINSFFINSLTLKWLNGSIILLSPYSFIPLIFILLSSLFDFNILVKCFLIVSLILRWLFRSFTIIPFSFIISLMILPSTLLNFLNFLNSISPISPVGLMGILQPRTPPHLLP